MVVNCAPALLFRLRSCLLLPAIPEQQAQSGCRRAGREQRLQHVVPGGIICTHRPRDPHWRCLPHKQYLVDKEPLLHWGKRGETLWAREFLSNELKDKSLVYGGMFNHLVPCPKCHPAPFVPCEGLPKPPAFVRDMRNNPMPGTC